MRFNFPLLLVEADAETPRDTLRRFFDALARELDALQDAIPNPLDVPWNTFFSILLFALCCWVGMWVIWGVMLVVGHFAAEAWHFIFWFYHGAPKGSEWLRRASGRILWIKGEDGWRAFRRGEFNVVLEAQPDSPGYLERESYSLARSVKKLTGSRDQFQWAPKKWSYRGNYLVLPCVLKEGVSIEYAEMVKTELEQEGHTVEIKHGSSDREDREQGSVAAD
ncbi:MAG: hypothetical protein H8E45_02335 [Proteobacteria bacterium]|nr:hypothetical protein [Pseudomonadota bacterium]